MFMEQIRNYGFAAVAATLYEIQKMYLKHRDYTCLTQEIQTHSPCCCSLGRGHQRPCALKPKAGSQHLTRESSCRAAEGGVTCCLLSCGERPPAPHLFRSTLCRSVINHCFACLTVLPLRWVSPGLIHLNCALFRSPG